MDNQFTKLLGEIDGQALVCETIAQDRNQEALTGESCEKEKNEEEARQWLLKAGVWREVEILVRTFANPAEKISPVVPNPLETAANLNL